MLQPVVVFVGRSLEKGRVTGPAALRRSGLAGDWNERRPAGDRDQAVCAYPVEHYEWWRERFPDRASQFRAGAFAENLSLAGLDETAVCVGDRWRVGTAVVEVSKPRGPCGKLAARHGLPELPAVIRQTLRTGWYLRVVSPGEVEPEADTELVERPWPAVSVSRVAEVMYHLRGDRAAAAEVLACTALAENWRAVLAARVAGRPEPEL